MTRSALYLTLLLTLILLSAISLLIGPTKIPMGEGMRALFGSGQEVVAVVMREIRLPRLLLSISIGFALGIAGAAMQGYLRNPLAEPGVLGVSASSALGAVIALQTGMVLGASALSDAAGLTAFFRLWGLPLAAMLGALLCAGLLLILGRNARAGRLILIGIGISAFAGALTALVLNLSPNPFAASEIMFWLMGSVANRSMAEFWMLAPFVLIGSLMLLSLGRSLDALSLGEDTAQSLGISLARVNILMILAVSMMVGASVAVAGAIGFIGLVVPHMLRTFVGEKPSRLLIPSGLGGACLLTLADILTRVIAPERDLKLGVLTALIGAPVFLHLVVTSSRRGVR